MLQSIQKQQLNRLNLHPQEKHDMFTEKKSELLVITVIIFINHINWSPMGKKKNFFFLNLYFFTLQT